MAIPKTEEFCDWLARLYPELLENPNDRTFLAKSVTFQMTVTWHVLIVIRDIREKGLCRLRRQRNSSTCCFRVRKA